LPYRFGAERGKNVIANTYISLSCLFILNGSHGQQKTVCDGKETLQVLRENLSAEELSKASAKH